MLKRNPGSSTKHQHELLWCAQFGFAIYCYQFLAQLLQLYGLSIKSEHRIVFRFSYEIYTDFSIDSLSLSLSLVVYLLFLALTFSLGMQLISIFQFLCQHGIGFMGLFVFIYSAIGCRWEPSVTWRKKTANDWTNINDMLSNKIIQSNLSKAEFLSSFSSSLSLPLSLPSSLSPSLSSTLWACCVYVPVGSKISYTNIAISFSHAHMVNC